MQAETFESQLLKLIEDAKADFHIADDVIAYILLRKGLNYYLKGIARHELDSKIKKVINKGS